MLIETLSNPQFVKSVFKSHLNSEDGHLKQLNTIAHLTGFKSWGNLQQFLKSPFIQDLNDLMADSLNNEKKATGLFPSSLCLFGPIQLFVCGSQDSDSRIDTLRLMNLFCYVAYHGAFNTLQSVVRKQPLVEPGDRPCLMAGYDLTKYSPENLFSQICYTFWDLPDIAVFLNEDDLPNSAELIQTIIGMDQRVFQDAEKTKSFLPAYWTIYSKHKNQVLLELGDIYTSSSEAITINVYDGTNNQGDTRLDFDQEDPWSMQFLLMPLPSGSFGLIKRNDGNGALLEYDEQEVKEIDNWCDGEFPLSPSQSDLSSHSWTLLPPDES